MNIPGWMMTEQEVYEKYPYMKDIHLCYKLILQSERTTMFYSSICNDNTRILLHTSFSTKSNYFNSVEYIIDVGNNKLVWNNLFYKKPSLFVTTCYNKCSKNMFVRTILDETEDNLDIYYEILGTRFSKNFKFGWMHKHIYVKILIRLCRLIKLVR